MPMPPPKPTTEGPRDRQVFNEMGQLLRALDVVGPCTPEELAGHVGATYWEAGRYERAVNFLLADGLAVRGPDGELQVSP